MCAANSSDRVGRCGWGRDQYPCEGRGPVLRSS
jgi:hypothetical protein